MAPRHLVTLFQSRSKNEMRVLPPNSYFFPPSISVEELYRIREAALHPD